jgi:SET domain-containing protein
MDANVIEVKYEVDEIKTMTIYSSVPDYLEIRDNSTQGYGVFTNKDIKKGETLFTMKYYYFNNEFNKKVNLKTNQGDYEIYKDINLLVESPELGYTIFGFDSLINHSCEIQVIWLKGNDEFTHLVIANKDLKAGDEIFFTYNLWFEELPKAIQFECHCGYENCQGFIQGWKYVDKDYCKILEKIRAMYYEN